MADGTAALDHVVVNVLRGMDEAARLFAALGFQLTPLGRHSLGSINHLMMTPGAYLELVGVPDEGRQRQEVLDSPFGLNGLVLKTSDADATFRRLTEAGFAASEPVAFSRPVEIDGAALEARFRTVRLPADSFPAGRVYFCEHLTPELVWREEWLDHPNGFEGIDGVLVASPDPEAEAARYAAAVDASPPDRRGERWQLALADAAIELEPANEPKFLSVGLRFRTLDRIEALARSLPQASWLSAELGPATLTLPSLALRMECRSSR
jgi:hypothetical protein